MQDTKNLSEVGLELVAQFDAIQNKDMKLALLDLLENLLREETAIAPMPSE